MHEAFGVSDGKPGSPAEISSVEAELRF